MLCPKNTEMSHVIYANMPDVAGEFVANTSCSGDGGEQRADADSALQPAADHDAEGGRP